MYGVVEAEEEFVSLNLQRKALVEFPLDLIEREIRSPKRPLRHIWLDDNSIAEIPPQLGLITELQNSLQELSICKNAVESLSTEIGCLTRLKSLQLDDNPLSQSSIEALLHHVLPRLSQLEDLSMVNCGLSSIVVESFPPTLRRLNLASNSLTSLPTQWASLSNLRSLNASNNAISNDLIDIELPHSVTSLNLSGNRLSRIPSSVQKMVGLQYLDLSSNRIASIEEDAWSMLSLVQRVSLDYNRIESLPLSNTTTNNVITTVGNPINPVEPPSKMFERCWSCARDYSTLCKLGITHVLTVAIELKPPFSDTLSYKQVPIDDFREGEDIFSHLQSCFDFIEEGLTHGSVLVHCAAGMSRSASVMTAYTMKRERLSFEEALEYIRSRRPKVCPNDSFKAQLRRWEAHLFQSETTM